MSSQALTTAMKGCVVQATGANAGHYRVSGLSTPGPVFVQGVYPSKTDIVAPHACFGNDHQFFVFGRGFGDISVEIEMYLGTNTGGGLEGNLHDFFETNRVASKLSPVIVTSKGGKAYSFFLTGFRVVSINPDFHSVTAQLIGKLID